MPTVCELPSSRMVRNNVCIVAMDIDAAQILTTAMRILVQGRMTVAGRRTQERD